MSDHDSNCTVIGCSIGCYAIERWLEEACREADFIGGRIVVCIDHLGRHMPLVGIDRLVVFLVVVKFPVEFAGCPDVVVEGDLRIDGESADVVPFVRIADLDFVGGKFVEGYCLGGVAHPVLLPDDFCKGCLEIGYHFEHLGLGLFREVSLDIHLAYSVAHEVVHEGLGHFPPWGLLLDSVEFLVEVEVFVGEVVGQY